MIENSKLHVEELKERFSQLKIIKVEDFQEFYQDVFGEIKKSTVSWMIYQLKKDNIIKRVSRGQYAIVDAVKNPSNDHVVITMDIIKSTEQDYNTFNKNIRTIINELNEIVNRVYKYNRNYNISQGDEIQIVCNFDENNGHLLMLTLSFLHPYKVRYGMGIGEVEEVFKDNSWDMNGPIFLKARDQLIKLKDAKDYEGLIVSNSNQIDQMCNNLLPLINKTISRITDKQWEAIRFELSKYDMEETISRLGISKTSYYERLKGSNLDEIIGAYKTIIGLLKMRERKV